jgi:hypothetical protein
MSEEKIILTDLSTSLDDQDQDDQINQDDQSKKQNTTHFDLFDENKPYPTQTNYDVECPHYNTDYCINLIPDYRLNIVTKKNLKKFPLVKKNVPYYNSRYSKKLTYNPKDLKLIDNIPKRFMLNNCTVDMIFIALTQSKDKLFTKEKYIIQYNSKYLPNTQYWNAWKDFNKNTNPDHIWISTLFNDNFPAYNYTDDSIIKLLLFYCYIYKYSGLVFCLNKIKNKFYFWDQNMYTSRIPKKTSTRLLSQKLVITDYEKWYKLGLFMMDDYILSVVNDYFRVDIWYTIRSEYQVYQSKFIYQHLYSHIFKNIRTGVFYRSIHHTNNLYTYKDKKYICEEFNNNIFDINCDNLSQVDEQNDVLDIINFYLKYDIAPDDNIHILLATKCDEIEKNPILVEYLNKHPNILFGVKKFLV